MNQNCGLECSGLVDFRFNTLEEAIRKQKKATRRLVIFAIGIGLYLVRVEIRGRIQRAEIDQLQKELAERNEKKGE